jgi:hypothetical protein
MGLWPGAQGSQRPARSEIPRRPCDFPAFPPGPVDSHVEDNPNEKELTMKTDTVLYAEDVPHYSVIEIEALDTVDAIEKAQNCDLTDVPTNPDWHNVVARLGIPDRALQIGRPAQQCTGRSLVKVGGTYVA